MKQALNMTERLEGPLQYNSTASPHVDLIKYKYFRTFYNILDISEACKLYVTISLAKPLTIAYVTIKNFINYEI